MRNKLVLSATLLFTASLPWQANAATVDINLVGPGVSGTMALTYGTATDSKYPQAFEVTGITGTFSDSNSGLNIVNAPIGALEPIKHDAPDPTNLLAPHDFTRFPVAVGLAHGSLSFDNLYYPGGSPQTATDYPLHGGVLDIYGLLFNIGGGTLVNVWSNGDLSGTGTGHIDYGVAVVTSAASLDYVSGGASVTPEPGALGLLGTGLLAMMLVWRLRAARQS